MRQTDRRQTSDAHHRLMPSPTERGVITGRLTSARYLCYVFMLTTNADARSVCGIQSYRLTLEAQQYQRMCLSLSFPAIPIPMQLFSPPMVRITLDDRWKQATLLTVGPVRASGL